MNISGKIKNEMKTKVCVIEFQKALEEKVEAREIELSDHTIEDYCYELYLFFKKLKLPFNRRPTMEQTKQWRKDCIDIYSRKGMAKKIVVLNHYLHLVCGAPEKPLPQIKHISRARVPLVLDGEQIFDMIKYAEDRGKYTVAAMIHTTFVTACRNAVLPTIRLSDLNFKNDKSTITLRKCKGNKDLHVPVSAKDMLKIKTYIEKHRKNPAPGHEDWLFLNKKGEQISDQKLRRALKYCARGVGIRECVHPHVLRHSRIKYCRVVLGMRDEEVICLTGHTKVSTLHESYTVEEDIDNVLKKLNADSVQDNNIAPPSNSESNLEKELKLMELKLKLAQQEKENIENQRKNMEMQLELNNTNEWEKPKLHQNADQKGYEIRDTL
jgi:site-specific recombinase XerD